MQRPSTVNAQYNVARPDSLAVRLIGHQRRKMYAAFLDALAPGRDETILDVGATDDQSYASSNYLEAWYPHKDRLTAAGLDDAAFLSTLYPGLSFVRLSVGRLPFADNAFDHVHSSAVLEHVGSRENQLFFLGELFRVARRCVFLTTPNRWFPVEFHTGLPLLHWLPALWYRSILRRLGLDFFADPANLNLLGPGDLAALARAAGMTNVRLRSVRLFAWPTNLLLIAQKEA